MGAAPAAGLYIELRALIDKFQQDMNGAVGVLTKTEKSITGVMGNIQKGIQAALVIGGVVAVKKLADALVDLAEKGDVAGDIADNFKQLGGSVTEIAKAKDALNGMVDSFDLMKIANEGLIKQIPGLNDNFAKIADLGGRVAEAMGTDVKTGIEQVIGALSTAKDKQLQAIGATIDTAKAYKTYADAIGVSVKALDDAQKKEARQIEVIKNLDKTIDSFAKRTVGVADAYQALNTAIGEGEKKMGMAINDNKELSKAFEELRKVVDEIDWTGIGEAIGTIASALINLASTITGTVLGALAELARGFNAIFGSGTQAQADRLASDIVDFENRLKYLTKDTNLSSMRDWAKNEATDITNKLPEMKAKFKELFDTLKGGSATSADAKKGIDGIGQGADGLKPKLKATADQIKEAGKETDKWKEKWQDLISSSGMDSLEKQIDAAIDGLNTADFTRLKEQLGNAIEEGFVKKWQEAIKTGAVKESDVRAQGRKEADLKVGEYETKMKEANERLAKDAQQKFAGAFDSIADSLSSIFDNFGDEFGSAFKVISSSLSEETKAGLTEGLASFLGTDAKGLEQYGAAISTAINAGLNAGAIDKATSSNKGTGGAIGATGGGAIGAIFGPEGAVIGSSIGNAIGSAIGGMFKWGPQNADTQARKALSGTLEDLIKAIGGLKFFNEKGQAQNVTDIKARPFGDFNDPNWGGQFSEKFGKETAGTFDAVGKAIGAMFGDAGTKLEQVGPMLAESLGGSLEGLKALVQGLGVSFEDVQKKLIEAGKMGKMTWLEVESAIEKTSEALKPGLKAVGAFEQAFSNLLQTGARGQVALNQLKNVALEAKEAGVKTLDELKNKLTASGKFDQDAINGLFAALAQRGIKSFDALAGASDRTLGAIIADMQAAGVKFEDGFKPLQDAITAIQGMPDNQEKNITFNVKTNMDKTTEEVVEPNVEAVKGLAMSEGRQVMKFARGGIVNGRSMFRHSRGYGLMGEAGPEAILPLKRVNGKLGVMAEMSGGGGTNVHININAPGAAPGVEETIRQSIMEMEDIIVNKSVEATMDYVRRGG